MIAVQNERAMIAVQNEGILPSPPTTWYDKQTKGYDN